MPASSSASLMAAISASAATAADASVEITEGRVFERGVTSPLASWA